MWYDLFRWCCPGYNFVYTYIFLAGILLPVVYWTATALCFSEIDYLHTMQAGFLWPVGLCIGSLTQTCKLCAFSWLLCPSKAASAPAFSDLEANVEHRQLE